MKKKAVIVLGMHRSGTSVITAGLEAMGVYIGDNYLAQGAHNKKGYFENIDIVLFNDRLFEFLHSRWDNPLFDGRRALGGCEEKTLSFWYEEAGEILLKNFADEPIWAVKDPRMCQLLFFWTNVFERNGLNAGNTYYLHMIRNPLEVALSQLQRHRINPEFYFLGGDPRQTVLLWISSHYQALRDVNSDHNLAVSFDDLLKDPYAEMSRIARFVDMDISRNKMEDYLSTFLEKDLKHHNLDPVRSDELEGSSPPAKALYDRLMDFSKRPSFDRDDIRDALSKLEFYKQAHELFSPMYPMLSDAWYKWWEMHKEYRALKKEYDRIVNSRTWRMAHRIKIILEKIPGGGFILDRFKRMYDYFEGGKN